MRKRIEKKRVTLRPIQNKKVTTICINCQIKRVTPTGEARKFGWCIGCYEKFLQYKKQSPKTSDNNSSSCSEWYVKPKMDLSRNSDYWRVAMMIRLKSRFRQIALLAYSSRCVLCGVSSDKAQLEVDHIKPVSKFPELQFDLMNTQILCHQCNVTKSNHHSEDYRTPYQYKRMVAKFESIPETDQIKLVTNLRKNMKHYLSLTFKEQVTGKIEDR